MLLLRTCAHRLAVRTSDSHSGNTGSIPVGRAKILYVLQAGRGMTRDELKTAVWNADDIRRYYMSLSKNKWLVNLRCREIAGEQWRQWPRDKSVWVSDLGRVRINDVIVVQRDVGADKSKWRHINRSVFRRSGIGYAGVKIKDRVEFVYHLVADTWLGGHDGLVVHHISDDGYDNSVYNLVCLTASQHSGLHSVRSTGKYTPRWVAGTMQQ